MKANWVCRLKGCAPSGEYQLWSMASTFGPGSELGPFMVEAHAIGTKRARSQVLARIKVFAQRCSRCGAWVLKRPRPLWRW